MADFLMLDNVIGYFLFIDKLAYLHDSLKHLFTIPPSLRLSLFMRLENSSILEQKQLTMVPIPVEPEGIITNKFIDPQQYIIRHIAPLSHAAQLSKFIAKNARFIRLTNSGGDVHPSSPEWKKMTANFRQHQQELAHIYTILQAVYTYCRTKQDRAKRRTSLSLAHFSRSCEIHLCKYISCNFRYS